MSKIRHLTCLINPLTNIKTNVKTNYLSSKHSRLFEFKRLFSKHKQNLEKIEFEISDQFDMLNW